jgi:hypothetical protein
MAGSTKRNASTRVRDSITGRYVEKKQAKLRPKTTETEVVRKRKK